MSDEDSPRRRSPLGRGLEALFSENPAPFSLDTPRQPRTLPIEALQPNPYQPRRRFDQDNLDSLAQSIRDQGLLQPILVRPLFGEPDRFQIVAGERRWRAAQQARLHEVPVVVRDLSDRDALQIALIENVQRQDLTAIEEAEGYRRLIAEFHLTQEDLAHAVGKSRSHLANTLRLLDLPEAVRVMVQDGRLSAGHGRALLACRDPAGAAEAVLRRGLNVRQTEALARQDSASAKPDLSPLAGAIHDSAESSAHRSRRPTTADSPKHPDTQALEEEMSALLGLEVSIALGKGQAGVLSVHYATLDQLDDLLRRLGAGHRPA